MAASATFPEALRTTYPQKLLVGQVQKKTEARLRASLSPARGAEFLGGGGPGSVGFLSYPSEADCSLENAFWCTAVRQRLGVPRAE